MPNYCTFETTICGDAENLQSLKERLGESGILGVEEYDNLFDEPARKYFEWGSKWMQFYIEYSEGEDSMYISGETAWNPISGLWQRISEKYDVSVSTTYAEPIVGFAGKDEWKSGEKTFGEEMTYIEHLYHNDYEYFWDSLVKNCAGTELGEAISALGRAYEKMSDSERRKVAEIHQAENE